MPIAICEQGQRFRVKDKTYGQFSDNYFNRLARLRPVLLEVAKREFPNTRGECSLRLPYSADMLLLRVR